MDYRTSARPTEIIKSGPQFTFIEKLFISEKFLPNALGTVLLTLKRSYVTLGFIVKGATAIVLFGLFAYLNYLLCFHFMRQLVFYNPTDVIAFSCIFAIVPMALEGYGLHLLRVNIREEIYGIRQGIRKKRNEYKEMGFREKTNCKEQE